MATVNEVTAEELAEYDAETVRLLNESESLVREAEADWEALKATTSNAKKRHETLQADLCKLIRERQELRGKRPQPTLLDYIPQGAHHQPAALPWRERKVDSLAVDPGILAHLSFHQLANLGQLHDELSAYNPTDGVPFGLSAGDAATIRMAIQELIDAEQAKPAPAPVAVAIPEDLWKSFPVERWTQFGLTAKDVEKLAAGEIKGEDKRAPIATVGDLSAFSAPNGSGWSRKLTDIKGIGAAGADRISDAEMRFWNFWNDGGEKQFAAERGLIGGNAPSAGCVSEGSGDVGSGEATGAGISPEPVELQRLADDGGPHHDDEPAGIEDTAIYEPGDEGEGETLSYDIRENGI